MKIKKTTQEITQICLTIRKNIIKMTTKAGAGHVTSSLSAVEIMAALLFGGFFEHPNYSEFKDLESRELNKKLNKIGCDRFIFSKGHASPLFYSLYRELGVLSDLDLTTFRQFESVLEGHPTPRFAWTEATTGSLGQGLGIGVGLALGLGKFEKAGIGNEKNGSEKLQNDLENDLQNSQKNSKKPNVFVLLGDSEMAEGSVWEALNSASFWQISNLVAIVDLNRLGQTGETQIGWESEVLKKKLESFGSLVWQVDGHNLEDLSRIYTQVLNCKEPKPKVIIAKTVKGKGVSFLENAQNWHGKALDKTQLEKALVEII